MKSEKANKEVAALIELAGTEYDKEAFIAKLKEVREMARLEKDPALVKIFRLCYEFIEENDNFDIGFLEEEGIDDMNDLQYLLELILRSDREVNRAEIREIRDLLIEELY